MAAEPPLASHARKPFSDVFSGYQTSHVVSLNETRQFGAIIHEIERVRSRFESEKSNSDQFSQQMRMLAQQIESLTNQQSTMIGFHIGRMDSMLKELKTSSDAISKAKRRAAFDAEEHAKLEQERRERERSERARIERGRIEHEERERQELQEKFECERIEREQNRERERQEGERKQREYEERQREEREHRGKTECLRPSSLPAMNLSEIIPQPSRTVKPSKRKLSLDLSTRAPPSSSFWNPLDQGPSGGAAKRARTQSDTSNNCDLGAPELSAPTVADMDTSADPVDPFSGASAEGSLPADIQELLKQQALSMLQAQLAMTNSSDAIKPEPCDLPSASLPPMSLPARAEPCSSSSSGSAGAVLVKQGEIDYLQATSVRHPAKPELVKPEPSPAAADKPLKPKNVAAPSKKSSAKKAKKAATPAVEDTTIADPKSVPLKNKAIHEWMSKDPERLYTADDICKAGIRYRASQSNSRTGARKGKIYILSCARDVRVQLQAKFNNKRIWKFDAGGWKVILQ